MTDPDPTLNNLLAGGGIIAALSAPLAIAWTGYTWLMGRIDERTALAVERALRQVQDAREAALREARAELLAHIDAQIASLEERVKEHSAASRTQSAAVMAGLDELKKMVGGDRE